jgi:predicted NUDIX family NTP pyrophosphohydrolase
MLFIDPSARLITYSFRRLASRIATHVPSLSCVIMGKTRSAGILLYRHLPSSSVEILLVHPGGPFWSRKRQHGFGVPKSEFEPGREEAMACARREFAEEMGQPAPNVDKLEWLGEFNAGHKIIHVWIAEAGVFGGVLALCAGIM